MLQQRKHDRKHIEIDFSMESFGPSRRERKKELEIRSDAFIEGFKRGQLMPGQDGKKALETYMSKYK